MKYKTVTFNDLLSPRSTQLYKTISRGVATNPSYQSYFKTLLTIINRLHEHDGMAKARQTLENLLEIIEKNDHIEFNENLNQVLALKSKRLDEIRSANTLATSQAVSLFQADSDLIPKLLIIADDLNGSLKHILSMEKYLSSSKGPKLNLFQAALAKKVINYLAPIVSSSGPVRIKEPFDGCFKSIRSNDGSGIISELKVAVIVINLLGQRITERQLADLIRKFNRLPLHLKKDEFIESCRYFSRFKVYEYS